MMGSNGLTPLIRNAPMVFLPQFSLVVFYMGILLRNDGTRS